MTCHDEVVGSVVDTIELARSMRLDILEMIHRAGASHVGSALSSADIMAVLYGSIMHIDPANPSDPERDRFVLSKGHGGTVVYAALAELGFLDREELLGSYYANGSVYSGHVSSKGVPGVEFSTGSLGQGVCVACGMALYAKTMNRKWRAFSVVGDGECDEGSVWEMALLASTKCLDNLIVVVDRNHQQSFGNGERTALVLGDVASKFRSFGWMTVDCDGHDHAALKAAFATPHPGKPLCVVAHTIKGKGVSFMEDNPRFHYAPPNDDDLEQALAEVTSAFAECSGTTIEVGE